MTAQVAPLRSRTRDGEATRDVILAAAAALLAAGGEEGFSIRGLWARGGGAGAALSHHAREPGEHGAYASVPLPLRVGAPAGTSVGGGGLVVRPAPAARPRRRGRRTAATPGRRGRRGVLGCGARGHVAAHRGVRAAARSCRRRARARRDARPADHTRPRAREARETTRWARVNPPRTRSSRAPSVPGAKRAGRPIWK